MVGVAPDDGSRRRLPPWMLGISSAGQVRNGKQLEEGGASQGIQPQENEALGENVLVKCETKRRKRTSTEQDADYEANVAGTVPETKRTGRGRRNVMEFVALERSKAEDPGRGIQLQQKETLGENSQFLVKCETKRRKRKSSEQDAECDGNVLETFPDNKCNGRGRRIDQESDAPKRQKAKSSSCGSDGKQELRTSTDDDVELTAEDLVIIAEEYIKADRNMKQEQESKQDCESDRRLAKRVSSCNELEDSVDAQNYNPRLVIPDTTTSMPNGRSISKEIVFGSSGTGDPTQDMLDLFLGPLLKKTVEKEVKTRQLTEDVSLAQEIQRQRQSKVINVVREDIAPVTKKKSSLKDKVAIFLD